MSTMALAAVHTPARGGVGARG